jgi:hypothetical protein
MRDGWLSVSEIISFPDHPFLLNWARKLALQGLDHNRVSTLGKYAGRIMHWEMLQKYGNSLDPMPKEVVDAYSDPEAVEHGGTAWAKLREWAVRERMEIAPLELELPIEDQELKVAARLDCLIAKNQLFDWKSSKHIYAESLLELGAYDYLWARAHPDMALRHWSIVQCTHDDDIPAQVFNFEESDIKVAGMTFASMIPAVRAFKEFEAKARITIAGAREPDKEET